MTTYKVWIEIEAFDEETGEGQTYDAPGASVTSFENYDDAYAFAARLQAVGEVLADLRLTMTLTRDAATDERYCEHCGAGPADAEGNLPHYRDCQEA